MKKILATLLCLAMLLCSVAFAEELTYDPSVLPALGVDVVTLLLEDFGMQFDLTADMYAIEVSEEMFMQGVMSAYINEAQDMAFAVNYMQQSDDAGNNVADYDALAAYYTANGATSTQMITVNGMDAMLFGIDSAHAAGLAFLYEEGWALSFTFEGLTDEATALYATLVFSSIRPIEEA